MLTKERQIALPEYRQGECQRDRSRLRERGEPPVYRSGASFSPASPCSCQRLCHAACQEKKQAPRQSLATINHSDIPGLSCRLQEKASAPPVRTKTRNRFADKKASPVGRAEDMPVCLFAQGSFASSEYLVQLTSSLAQKVCLAWGSPRPPGEWLKSHIAQPSTHSHETPNLHPAALYQRCRHRHHSLLWNPPCQRIPDHLHQRH